MKKISFTCWDRAYDPAARRNFTMPLLPMSMLQPELPQVYRL